MVAGPGLEIRVAQTFEKSAPAIVAISILLTIVTGLALSPMPEFQTDLAAFAPDSDADAAIDRMEEVMPPSHTVFMSISNQHKKEQMYWKWELCSNFTPILKQ